MHPHQGYSLHDQPLSGGKSATSQEEACLWSRYYVPGTHEQGQRVFTTMEFPLPAWKLAEGMLRAPAAQLAALSSPACQQRIPFVY